MRLPPLNALRMFDAAARHLNFRIAAAELHLTQGAVAQQVRRLEADLGLKLFDRQARGLALTRSGRDYSVAVRQALARIEEATLKLRPETGRITLSVPPSFAAKWLMPRLLSFTTRYPDIGVQIVASETLADFRSDGVDLAIRQGKPPFGKGLRTTLLSRLHLCAVCSPAYAAKITSIDRVEDFERQTLIDDGHDHWDRILQDRILYRTHGSLKFSHTALALDAAADGQGVALVPRLLADAGLMSGRLVELWQDRQMDSSGYYIVSPDTGPPAPAMETMRRWLEAEVAAKTPIHADGRVLDDPAAGRGSMLNVGAVQPV